MRPVLRIVAAYIVGSVCDHLVNFFHLGFRIYETAHRIWLRIVSIALEKELESLTLLMITVRTKQAP